MQLIDGKKISLEITRKIGLEVEGLEEKPGLAFILVGDNPASQIYVAAKKKACTKVGIRSHLLEFPNTISQIDLLSQIDQLNKDRSIDSILVQLPLPLHIDEKIVMSSIDPEKDVDGFHPINMGKLLLGDSSATVPCTPLGIKTLLEKSHIRVSGKHVVIIGRSNIVGKPLAALLMQKKQGANATVTVCHSGSEQLVEIIQSADILISAIGLAKFIQKEMVKKGAIIIDVGITRINGKIMGDVDFEQVAPLCSYITPVPGGVGPMTIAMLLENTLSNYKKIRGLERDIG